MKKWLWSAVTSTPLSSSKLITGFTSSARRTKSPITIASETPGFPGEKAVHDVSPMKGGSFQPSTATLMSLRGKVALTTPSPVSGFSTPVAIITAFSSRGVDGADVADTGAASIAAGVAGGVVVLVG